MSEVLINIFLKGQKTFVVAEIFQNLAFLPSIDSTFFFHWVILFSFSFLTRDCQLYQHLGNITCEVLKNILLSQVTLI